MTDKVHVTCYEDCFALYPGVTEVKAEYYGSYQGEFLCSIIKDGEYLLIHDWYGSCSGCDAFEAELGHGDVAREDAINFAESYINSAIPRHKMIEFLEKEVSDDSWCTEKKEMLQDLEGGKF